MWNNRRLTLLTAGRLPLFEPSVPGGNAGLFGPLTFRDVALEPLIVPGRTGGGGSRPLPNKESECERHVQCVFHNK